MIAIPTPSLPLYTHLPLNFCLVFHFLFPQLISNPHPLLPHLRHRLKREPPSHDAAPLSKTAASTTGSIGLPVHECEINVPKHFDGLRCRNASPKPFLIQGGDTCDVCALTHKLLRRSQWHLQ